MDADRKIRELIWPPPRDEADRTRVSDALDEIGGGGELLANAVEAIAMYSLLEPDSPGLWSRAEAEARLQELAQA